MNKLLQSLLLSLFFIVTGFAQSDPDLGVQWKNVEKGSLHIGINTFPDFGGGANTFHFGIPAEVRVEYFFKKRLSLQGYVGLETTIFWNNGEKALRSHGLNGGVDFRYYYLVKPKWTMYGSVGIGGGYQSNVFTEDGVSGPISGFAFGELRIGIGAEFAVSDRVSFITELPTEIRIYPDGDLIFFDFSARIGLKVRLGKALE